VDGLAAMAEVSHLDGIAILRPLLGMTRVRLEAFLRERGQHWIEDPSNRDDKYERVRIRRDLRERQALGLTVESLALSAKRLRRARDVLEAAATGFLTAAIDVRDAGYAEIGIEALLEAPEEIALRALSRMACAFGGRTLPPRLARLEALYGALRGGVRDATLGGCAFAIRRAKLLVTREYGRMSMRAVVVHPGQQLLWDGRFTISLPPDCPVGLLLRPLGPDGLAALHAMGGGMGTDPRAAALALPSLWQDGCLRFTPFAAWETFEPPEWLDGATACFAGRAALFGRLRDAEIHL